MICRCDFEDGDKVKYLDCLHNFHSDCIDPWLEKNSKCPICKTDLRE